MGIRNTPEQQRQYAAAKRERDAAAGWLRKEVRVHREDWPRVSRLVAELADARADGLRETPAPKQPF